MGNEFYSRIKSTCPSNNNRPLPLQDVQPHSGSQSTIEGGSSSNPSLGIPNQSFDLFKPSSFEFFNESTPYPSGGVGSVSRADDEVLLHVYKNDRLFRKGSVSFPIEKNQILGDNDPHRHQYQTLNFIEFGGESMNNTDKVSSCTTAANDKGIFHAYQNDRPPIIFSIEGNQIIGDDDHHHQNRSLNFKEFERRSVNNTDNVSSYTTAENGRSLKTKQTIFGGINERRVEMRRASRARSSSHTIKGQWTSEEDNMLIQLVEKHGEGKWAIIAKRMQTRVGKQCRERWYNHLHPDIKTSPWTEEEDIILIQLHSKLGNSWSEMAKRLPGRTENAIKNHWNATKRRQLSRRRTKSHQSSIQLKEYIQSVIRQSENANNGHGGGVPGDDDGHGPGDGSVVSRPGDGGAEMFIDCYKVERPVVDQHHQEMPYYGGGGGSSGNTFYEIPYHFEDFDMMMGLGGGGCVWNNAMDFLEMFPQKKS